MAVGACVKKTVILNLALFFLWHVVWPHGRGACRHILQWPCHRSIIDDVPFQGRRDSGSVIMRNAGDGLAVGGLAKTGRMKGSSYWLVAAIDSR